MAALARGICSTMRGRPKPAARGRDATMPSSPRRVALLWASVAGFLLSAGTLHAQQSTGGAAPAAQPAPLPTPTINSVLKDAPKTEAAAKLAPVAPPPIPTAADRLPVDKLTAPKGFKIEVFASGMTNARSLRVGDKGTVFVSSRLVDKIYAITTDKDGKREAKPLLTGLFRPNGIALHNGTLYIAELTQISKVENVEDHLGDAKPQVIYTDMPKDEPHGWRYLTVGPDNKLYFQIGAPCNICMP